MLALLREAVGFERKATGWFTTSKTNPKLAKSPYPTVGITLHSARRGRDVWASFDPAVRQTIATVLGVGVADIDAALELTLCPRSTEACRQACSPATSLNSQFPDADKTRLVREVFMLFRPELAFALTWDGLRKLRSKHGTKCRWRVNIADDVRWELLAPGLMRIVPAYSYTKFSPAERKGSDGFSVVYSATERHSDADIADMVGAGHRVAVVLDVPRLKVPATWQGMDVVNGDKTDDLFEHPVGTVVGLSAKGVSKEVKAEMRKSGFARKA